MDIVAVQNKLNAAGYNVGAADGALGPATYTGILNYVAGHHQAITVPLGQAICPDFAKYQINTPLRMAHFIAQGCHETQRWEFFTELGGPDYFKAYEGRKDLGNTVAGDGYKYRGRGIFQITGRYNYGGYGTKISIDLVNNPDRAAEPEVAALISCLFWTGHNCNALADNDDCTNITHKINGGTNGLLERLQFTHTLKALFGI